ncbi:MAG: tetratricopeptide repeat protein [Streptococcus thermophilus]
MERRTEILGKEHPYTLLSRACLGRVIAARGRLDEADRVMSKTLEVAVRNLGQNHPAQHPIRGNPS